MNINEIDSELFSKSKEIFKIILKKPDVEISFDQPNDYDDDYNIPDNVDDMTLVNQGNHNFILFKDFTIVELSMVNNKYYNILSKKRKEIIDKLPLDDKTKFFKRLGKYLFFLYPFFGKIIKREEEKKYSYKLNYNSVIINLSKLEYDRFCYYSSYVYKLKQLKELNSELNIVQEFTIIFDDDQTTYNLYKNISDSFKNIIGPSDTNY